MFTRGSVRRRKAGSGWWAPPSDYDDYDGAVKPASMASMLAAALGYAVSLWIGGAASAAAFHPPANDDRVSPALHDAVQAKLPQWDFTDPDSALYGMPDKLLALLLCGTAWLVLKDGLVRAALVAREVMMLHGVLVLVRASTVAVTTMPSPVRACRNLQAVPDTGYHFVPIWCNDCLFSGHASTFFLCACVWSCSRAHVLVKALAWVTAAAASFMSVAVRDHYSVDVLVAFYITALAAWAARDRLTRAFCSPIAGVTLGK